MRSRDRLAEFRQRCGSAHARLSDDVEAAHAAAAAAPESADDAELHSVLQQAERVHTWLRRLEHNARVLAALHADLSYFTCNGTQDQVEALTSESSRLGAQICSEAAALGARGAADGGAAARAARLQAATARARLSRALAALEDVLSEARGARLKVLRKQLQLTNQSVTEEECEDLLDTGNIAIFVDNVEAREHSARLALRDAEARRAELLAVEAALRDVHALFMQLASMVHLQQDSIDRIEYWAQSASAHVDAGGRELLQGTVIRKKAHKKKLSLIICVMAGAAVVLAVLVLT